MKTCFQMILFTIFFISCSKVENGLDVSVTGYVRLFGEKGSEIFNRQDVRVSEKGTSIETFTDENGKYLIAELRAGNRYNFEFSKDSFGTKKINDIQFIGEGKPGLLNTISLYGIPSYELVSATLTYESSRIRVSGITTEADNYKLTAYINDNSNVSDTHYDSYTDYSLMPIGRKFTSLNFFINLYDVNYAPGTTVYIAIYFYNYYEPEYSYYEPDLKAIRLSSGKKASMILLITI